MNKIPLSGGDEFDAFGRARKWYNWRKITVKWVKNKYRRRFRREEKKFIKKEIEDC